MFSPDEYVGSIEDTTSGDGAPDLEIFSSPLAWKDHGQGIVPKGDLTSMAAVLLRLVRQCPEVFISFTNCEFQADKLGDPVTQLVRSFRKAHY